MRHAIAWLLLAGQAAVPPAVPLEPLNAIFNAFRTHDVVALGVGVHGNDQISVFGLTLLRAPRSPITDVVLEGVNAFYQDVVDRYVRGEDVKEADVMEAWVNSTQTRFFLQPPRTDDFMRAVRALNMKLPAQRRIRVLLGDPPLDWTTIHTHDDYQKVLALRDSFPADMIRREVVNKHRKALLLYGVMHFQRKQLFSNYDMSSPLAQTVVSLLENGPRAVRVFNIYTLMGDIASQQPEVASWRPLPRLALVRGTALGQQDFTKFYLTNRVAPPMRMEDQFDAVMYLTTTVTINGVRPGAQVPPGTNERCRDRAYIEMHFARMALEQLPQSEIDAVKRACGLP
jgi:hypothetical protein